MKKLKASRPLVYICSRYARDKTENDEVAQQYSRFATNQRVVPVAPLLLFSQIIKERAEQRPVIVLNLAIQKQRDETWVFGVEKGASAGVCIEIMSVDDNGQEIYYFAEDCKVYV